MTKLIYFDLYGLKSCERTIVYITESINLTKSNEEWQTKMNFNVVTHCPAPNSQSIQHVLVVYLQNVQYK